MAVYHNNMSNGAGLSSASDCCRDLTQWNAVSMQQISQKLICGLFIDVMKWTAVHIKWRGMSIDSVCECECIVQYILLWTAWLNHSVYQGNTLFP